MDVKEAARWPRGRRARPGGPGAPHPRGERPVADGGHAVGVRPPRRALLPHGRLVASLTSTPSLLDCVCFKKDPREGFVPFDIPFLRNTELGKNNNLHWAFG